MSNKHIKLGSLLKGRALKEQQNVVDDLSKSAGSAARLKVPNTVYFYVVTKASPNSTLGDILFKIDPIGFANQIRGGLKPEEIVIITMDQDEALNAAHDQLGAPGDDKSVELGGRTLGGGK